MTTSDITFRNARVFDGAQLWEKSVVQFQAGTLIACGPDVRDSGTVIDLDGDIISIGFVDLQVNGGGGVMFNDDPTVDTLRRIAQAHHRLGVTRLLPTLITDAPDVTHRAIDAACAACAANVPGVAGLHLEGPHLSVVRKGAHDAALIRPMEPADLELLLAAAAALPVLKVTLAPENATLAQVATLAQAGVLISLGHSDADFDTCQQYFAAGARCATHLFNAMSQIGNRAPGLAGAAVSHPDVSAGLIADAVHVHPEVMRMAWAAKRAPGQIFLVSDAMAVAGTAEESFELNGRRILRKDGQLRLADGTLAGADLDLASALGVMVGQVGVGLQEALSAATCVPAALCGMAGYGLRAGVTQMEDVIRINADLTGAAPLRDTLS